MFTIFVVSMQWCGDGKRNIMGLVKKLNVNESIYNITPLARTERPVKIAIDRNGNEYYFNGYNKEDESTMNVSHDNGINCSVYSKGFRIVLKELGYKVKPIK